MSEEREAQHDVQQAKGKIRHHVAGLTLSDKRLGKWRRRRAKSETRLQQAESALQAAKDSGAPKREIRALEARFEAAQLDHQRNTKKVLHWRKRRAAAYRLVHYWKDALRARVARLKGIRNADGFEDRMLNGHPGNVSNAVKRVIYIGVTRFGLYTTSTTDGSSHAPSSYHYPRNDPTPPQEGNGVDMAGAWQAMIDFQQFLISQRNDLNELFGPANELCVKHGVQFTILEGTPLEQGHDNHDHIAPTAGFMDGKEV